MKKTFLILVISFFSCRNNQQEIILIPSEATKVYSVVLDSIASKMNRTALLLLDSTTTGYTLSYLHAGWVTNQASRAKDSNTTRMNGMIPQFEKLDSTSISIDEKSLHISRPLRTFSYANIVKERDSLAMGNSIVSVSQVAFTSDTTYALVFVEEYIALTNGSGCFILLQKKDSQWVPIHSHRRWIS